MPIREAGRVRAKGRPRCPAADLQRLAHPLELWRHRARLTRRAVAKAAGIDFATLWRIETGKVTPHQSTEAAVRRAILTLTRQRKPRRGRR